MKKTIAVYRVARDPHYRHLVPEDERAFELARAHSWAFDGRPPSDWVELRMRPSDEGVEEPDIWEVVPGVFALERAAYRELSSSAEETQRGDMYFLKVGRRKLAVVNSTLCIDCLDVENSVFDEGGATVVDWSFESSQLAVSLFKIPQTRNRELYALDGFDEENDFKAIVERSGFTGLLFEALWTGDSWMDA